MNRLIQTCKRDEPTLAHRARFTRPGLAARTLLEATLVLGGLMLSVPANASGLAVEGRITGSVACGDAPDTPIVTLVLDIDLSVTNDGQRTLILARRELTSDWTGVAVSLDNAKQRDFLVDMEWLPPVDPPDYPQESFSHPDERHFILLEPGETAGLQSSSTVFVNRGPGAPAGTVPAGSSYLVQEKIPSWPYPRAVFDDLSERWKEIGDLAGGSLTTPFMPFDVPATFGEVPRCSDVEIP